MPADMTQSQLAVKLQDLGHQYLTAARAESMIDTAVKDAILEELWPFRRRLAPLTGSDLSTGGVNLGLGPIEQVVDLSQGGPGRVLVPRRADSLRDDYGDLTRPGPARFYYAGYNDTTISLNRVLAFYPTTVTSVKVWHFSEASWTIGGRAPQSNTDYPLWPNTHYEVILSRARTLAYEDIDDYDAAAQQEAKYQRRLDLARDQLLQDQWDESVNVTITQELV